MCIRDRVLQEETTPEADAMRKMILATLLLTLKDLCRQQQEQGGENGRVSNHIVDQIQAYIAEHYAEKLTLTGIASQFYISPYYLSRLFKKSINLSLIEYINGVLSLIHISLHGSWFSPPHSCLHG